MFTLQGAADIWLGRFGVGECLGQEHCSCEGERVEQDDVLFLGNDGLINPRP